MFDKLNIKTPQDLMKYFENNLNYGFTYKNKVFTDMEPDFQKNMDRLYKIRLGEDFLKNRYGVCWDFCEFERLFFLEKNIEHQCFFIASCVAEDQGGPTHTFTLYKQNNKWYWFEYSWLYCRGIWEYNSKEDALKDILNKFDEFYDKKLFDIELFLTDRVIKRLNVYEFVNHCINGEKIKL